MPREAVTSSTSAMPQHPAGQRPSWTVHARLGQLGRKPPGLLRALSSHFCGQCLHRGKWTVFKASENSGHLCSSEENCHGCLLASRMKDAQSGQVKDKGDMNFFSSRHTCSNSSFSNKEHLTHGSGPAHWGLPPLASVLRFPTLCLREMFQLSSIPTGTEAGLQSVKAPSGER